MIAIGGMGLASTMGMAVLERRREIGVLRAIGASGRAIMMLLQAEGMVITLLAWVACLPLSIPVGALMAEAFGRIMFPVPVPLMPDPVAALRWLAIMAAISIVACAWAARRALRVPTAQALAYE
jgi:putative ABC transport system permease protein